MKIFKSIILLLGVLVVAALVSGCGEEGIQISKNDPNYQGAKIFSERCSGCHTLSFAGTQGSGTAHSKEYTDGPNFDTRKEKVEDVLYAIRNGGFSGRIMPANIVVGSDAQKVAEFVAARSGKDKKQP